MMRLSTSEARIELRRRLVTNLYKVVVLFANQLNSIQPSGIDYLIQNWDSETTTCRENGGECKRDAQPVRKYMGLRSTTDPLFQIEKVFVKAKYMDIDPEDLEKYYEAMEDYNACMAMSNSMAFISQFGEYNPGGGKDEVLKYLDESKIQVKLAQKNLGIMMGILKIE